MFFYLNKKKSRYDCCNIQQFCATFNYKFLLTHLQNGWGSADLGKAQPGCGFKSGEIYISPGSLSPRKCSSHVNAEAQEDKPNYS